MRANPVSNTYATRRVALLAALLVALTLPLALGQTGDSSSSNDPRQNVDASDRLAELEAEFQRESAEWETLRTARKSEIAQLQRERDELADRILDLEPERAQLREELSIHPVDPGEIEHFRQQLDRLERLRLDTLEQIGVARQELPYPFEPLPALVKDPTDSSDSDSGDWERWRAIVDEHFDTARTARRVQTSLVTADGTQQDVDLVGMGHVAFAYRRVDNGAIGVSISSPRDASGYRWTESLTAGEAELWTEAIDRLSVGQPKSLSSPTTWLPIDPSGHFTAKPARPSLFARLVSGGPVMVPLGLIALAALLMISERIVHFWRERGPATGAFQAAIEQARIGAAEVGAHSLSKARGPAARTASAALSASHRSATDSAVGVEDAIQAQLLIEVPRLRRRLGTLAFLGTVAPLLGLLGTVSGIIGAFGALQGLGSAATGQLAAGISEALVTTATGLTIAIPILLAHRWLRSVADERLAITEQIAAEVLLTVAATGTATGDINDSREDSK